MGYLLAFVLSTYHPPTVGLGSLADTGMGKCKDMDSHYHNDDGLCHRDKDDSPLVTLPVNPDDIQI